VEIVMTAPSFSSVVVIAVALAFTGPFAVDSPGAQTTPAPPGKPQARSATASPSRTPDGQPNIQGVWGGAENGGWSYHLEPREHLNAMGWPKPRPGAKIQSNSGPIPAPAIKVRPHAFYDPPDGILPYQPWALERRNSVLRGHDFPELWQVDTQTPGWPTGIPRENGYSSVDGSYGGPIQILQSPGYVVFLYETHHEFRIVPLDGRPQPGQDIKMWLGSSRGRWEGNTLVIDVANNNDSPRMSVVGDFRSDEMRATERWTLVDANTLEYRCTITDLKVFTKPWTMGLTFIRTPQGTEIMEYAGVEGSKGLKAIGR
jgi:hypothetical protein